MANDIAALTKAIRATGSVLDSVDGLAPDSRALLAAIVDKLNEHSTYLASHSETVTANGTLDHCTALPRESVIAITGTASGVLGDGTYVGQRKRLRVISAASSPAYTLTPTTMQAGQPTAFVFTDAGQMVDLTWAADGWVVTDVKTAGAGTTAAAGTINPLIARQGLTTNGSEDRILPNGYCPGHTIKIAVDTDTSGSTTISGLFYDEDGSADGIDITADSALDEVVLTWTGARWMGITHISAAVTP